MQELVHWYIWYAISQSPDNSFVMLTHIFYKITAMTRQNSFTLYYMKLEIKLVQNLWNGPNQVRKVELYQRQQ